MNNNQKELPLITLRGITVYPSLTMNLDVGRKKSVKAIEAAMEQNKEILLVSQKDLMNNEPNVEDIYKDRKSTRLNSSHVAISYAVFCLKKKNHFTSAIEAHNKHQYTC